MKEFRKKTRRRLIVCLAAAMVVLLLPGTVWAKTITKNMTMYVGETYTYSCQLKTSAVKSSNSKVVSAVKGKRYATEIDFKAKKLGKATVTARLGNRKTQFNVTVKKLPSISITMQALPQGDILFTIKNKSDQTFEKIKFEYTLRDKNGEVIKKNTEPCVYLLAKKTAYSTTYIGKTEVEAIDFKKSTAKLVSVEHDPGCAYKDISSKIDLFVFDQKEEEYNLKFKVNVDNLSSREATGQYYILIYDKDEKLLGVRECPFMLDGYAGTEDELILSRGAHGLYPGADHYKLVPQAFDFAKKKGWEERI